MKEKLLCLWRMPEVTKQLNKISVIALMLFFTLQIANAAPQKTVSGTITDETGQPLPGVTIMLKGTGSGTVTDANGTYSIPNIPEDGTLIFSFIGMSTQEVVVGTQTTINITMQTDAIGLEEVIAVGYGTQKKVNLTGAVSVATSEDIENRPVANVQQALQGVVPNLIISTSSATGEPGASMNMNIRGLTSLEGSSAPFVLVDNIPMDINQVDPNDIESISVLKDAASSAIYGSRAAYGVILITTKTGKKKSGVDVSYSGNFGISNFINFPDNADALSTAHTFNQARLNQGAAPYYSDEKLEWIEQNMANPGSAPEVLEHPNGLKWDIGTEGLNSSASTDWKSIIFKDHSTRMKHNLAISGGTENVNYYISGGFYDEQGMLKPADDYFKRYNVDAKIDVTATSWLRFSLLTKYMYTDEQYPEHKTLGRSFIMLGATRMKPTKPAYYPGTEVWTGRIGDMELNKTSNNERQLVLSPRFIIEPVKNWITNIELNYRTNDNKVERLFPRIPSAVPDGTGGSEVIWPSMETTLYRADLYTNSYMSPHIYSSYTKSLDKHNLHLMVGYQHEVYNYHNNYARAPHLLTEEIPSISTAVGEKTVSDGIGHWSTQGVFGRFKYNFAEKYLIEFNGRYDGSSRFAPDDRWGFFPSVSGGWVLSKENFFPLQERVDLFKLTASYGTIGNQNVANYLYIPTLGISETNWLFGGNRLWSVGSPNLTSVDLTWETVTTLNIGFDLLALNNRLGFNFEWYESKTSDLVGPGEAVPVLLGTSAPKRNAGEVTTKGWEIEVSWRDKIDDFSYGIKGVLSDNQSTVTKYSNPTNILTNYYEGMKLGEIWGVESDGLFQSADEVANHPIDQSYFYSGTWYPGDMKYIDQDGDNIMTIGDNTLDNPGDKKVIGNSRARFQFGISGNAAWKGFDFSFLFQGVGKRDLHLSSLGTFRGPANGPLHGNVYEEHLDFWRDETSPLGANPDAYFPNSYVQYTGQNNKNYRLPSTRFIQNGAYIRLKNAQLGYSIPKSILEKIKVSNLRIYLSGENLLTFTDLMIFDPEAFNGRTGRIGDQYPLSRVFSLGLNINF